MLSRNSERSDIDLVRAAQGGDDKAYTQLVDRHFGLVYSIAYARMSNREAAEDLAQEVFLQVFLHVKQLDTRRKVNFPAWVARITRNLAFHWQRKNQRRSELVPMVPLDKDSMQVSDHETDHSRDRMIAAEQRRAVERAVLDLPADQREMVVLHYTEKLSKKQIAQRLGMHPSTVGRQIDRAVSSMKGLVQTSLESTAPTLAASAKAPVYAAGLISAVAAMNEAARANLLASPTFTSAAAQAFETTRNVSRLSTFVKWLLPIILYGGTTMSTAKIVGGISAAVGVLVLSGVGYQYYESTKKTTKLTEMSSAVVTSSGEVNETNPEIRLWVDLTPGKTWKSETQVETTSDVEVSLKPGIIKSQTVVRTQMAHRTLPPNQQGQAQVENLVSGMQMTAVVDGKQVDPKETGMDIGRAMAGTKTIDVMDNFGRIVTSVEDDETKKDNIMTNPAVLALGNIDRIAMGELPEKSVRVGDTWTRVISAPDFVQFQSRYECKFDRIEETPQGRVAVITRRSVVDLDKPTPLGKIPIPEAGTEADMTFLSMTGETRHISRLLIDEGEWLNHFATTSFDLTTRMDLTVQGKPISIDMKTSGSETRTTEMKYGV